MSRAPDSAPARPVVSAAAGLLPAAAFVALGLVCFTATGRDDAYITYWAAQAFARFGHIVNYNGEYIEQSSSLAHVILLGGLATVIPLPVPVLGVLLSITGGVTAIYATGALADEAGTDLRRGAQWLAATAGGLVYWSLGGLETTLAATVYAAFALSLVRALRGGWPWRERLAVAAATVLAITVRPEGAPMVAAVLLGLWAWVLVGASRHEAHLRQRLLAVTLMFVVAAVVLSAWRLWYTGSLVPQPVVAKAGAMSVLKVRHGVVYVWQGIARIDGLTWVVGLAAAAFWSLAVLRRRTVPPGIAVPSFMVLAGFGFIVLNGGDWMEGQRFFVPLLPAAVTLVMATLHTSGAPRGALVVLLVMQVAGAGWLARTQSTGSPIWTASQPALSGASWFERRQRVNYRDVVFSQHLAEVVEEVRQSGRSQPVVMSVQMGMVSYRLASARYGTVRFLDPVSLVPDLFTACPLTRGLGHGVLGLELDYPSYLRRRDEFRLACGVPEPDVIFDVDDARWPTATAVSANGYDVVFRQWGDIANGSRLLPGRRVGSWQFVAVRRGLDVARRPDLVLRRAE